MVYDYSNTLYDAAIATNNVDGTFVGFSRRDRNYIFSVLVVDGPLPLVCTLHGTFLAS